MNIEELNKSKRDDKNVSLFIKDICVCYWLKLIILMMYLYY
jgi:hypothetical protein